MNDSIRNILRRIQAVTVLVFAGMMPAMSQDVRQDTIPAMQEGDSTFIAPPLIVPEMDTIAT